MPPGSLIGTLPVPELPQHCHLSPCHMNLPLKQKQSEDSWYFPLHTNLQCLVQLLTALGCEQPAVCWTG